MDFDPEAPPTSPVSPEQDGAGPDSAEYRLGEEEGDEQGNAPMTCDKGGRGTKSQNPWGCRQNSRRSRELVSMNCSAPEAQKDEYHMVWTVVRTMPQCGQPTDKA